MSEEEKNIENTEGIENEMQFIVDKKQEPIRIDKYLMDRLKNVSRTKIQAGAKAGKLIVNGKPVKSNYKVNPNDQIDLSYPKSEHVADLTPQDIPLDIMFEDEHVIVLNKQAGLVVHPGVGNTSGTLVNALLYHTKDLAVKDDESRAGLVHRLDKNTSGVMVVAKSDLAATNLSQQFFDRTTKRRYVALVWGDVVEDEGTIEGNIGRNLRDSKLFSVFEDGDMGKHAVTHYKVLQRFSYVTLVECRLETGRTHQIRVHMKHIGHTLFADDFYGGEKILKGTIYSKYKQFVNNCFTLCPRQALHARSLGFVHPATGEEMHFEKEMPEDMTALIEKWDRYTTAIFSK